MHRNTLLSVASLLLATSAFAAAHGGKVKWESPEAGFARAKAEDKKLMLYFTATW